MGALFSSPHISSPTPTPPAPAAPDAYAAEQAKIAADNQRKAAVGAKGRQSTVLTGGLGDYSLAPTQQRTLLGGG